MTPERIAELRRLAEAVHECAVSWEPNARLIGNVMASELAGFSVALPELLDALQAKDAEIEELKIDVASAEYLDSEAQIGAAEVSKELSALREENAALRARCERLEKVREAAEALCEQVEYVKYYTADSTALSAIRSALAAALEGK